MSLAARDEVSRPRLVLASGSPRRRELLHLLGLDFVVRSPRVDETPLEGEAARAYVERLARSKATFEVQPHECVVAADTSVVIDGTILGKPEDESEALAMLRRLSGRTHEVLTGVAVAYRPSQGEAALAAEVCHSSVCFRTLQEDDLHWYVATGEGRDKAGAYAVQGIGGLFIDRIEGNYHNIVGLPLTTLSDCFSRLGLQLRTWHLAPAAGPSPLP